LTTPTAEPWKLITAAQCGDREAFGALYGRYREVVFRYLMGRIPGDRATAEDLTSETFVRALRRLDSVSYHGRDPGAWFVTIARNLFLDYVKTSRYRTEITVGDMCDGLAEDPDNPETLVVNDIALGELRAQLDQAYWQLCPSFRRVVQLRFVDGLSVADTAEEMGLNQGATKAVQHRAVKRLRALLSNADW